MGAAGLAELGLHLLEPSSLVFRGKKGLGREVRSAGAFSSPLVLVLSKDGVQGRESVGGEGKVSVAAHNVFWNVPWGLGGKQTL